MTDSRHCPGCDRDLPLAAFGVNRHRKDGTMRTCRDCTNAHTRERRSTPEGRARYLAARERYLRKRYGSSVAA